MYEPPIYLQRIHISFILHVLNMILKVIHFNHIEHLQLHARIITIYLK